MKYTLDSIIRKTGTALRKSTLAAGLAASLFFGCSDFDTSASRGGKEGEAEGERDVMAERYDGSKGKREYDGGMNDGGKTNADLGTSIEKCKVDKRAAPSLEWFITSGLGDGYDSGSAIAIDPDRNIYVTGREGGGNTNIWLNKYNPDGNPLWDAPVLYDDLSGSNTASGNDIAIGPRGNIHIIGQESVVGESSNIWINKYNPAGIPLWPTHISYDDENRGDFGGGIAVDSVGNMYAIGSVRGSIWIHKYNANGNPVWADPLYAGGDDAFFSYGYGIATDEEENIYALGTMEIRRGDDSGGYNLWLNKYNSDGTPLWANPILYNGGDRAVGVDMALDSESNIYVTGWVYVEGECNNILINKYNPNGVQLWDEPLTQNFRDRDDYGHGITTDEEGSIYVTGSISVGGVGCKFASSADIWINKYDAEGNPLWLAPLTYDHPGRGRDSGRDIAVDSEGNIYVTGRVGLSYPTRLWLGKYSCNSDDE